MGYPRDNPPANWLGEGVIKVNDDIYYRWPEDGGNPTLWHWCITRERWSGRGTGLHELVAREPLHLEPSLLWPCCGLHGWVRAGAWSNA